MLHYGYPFDYATGAYNSSKDYRTHATMARIERGRTQELTDPRTHATMPGFEDRRAYDRNNRDRSRSRSRARSRGRTDYTDHFTYRTGQDRSRSRSRDSMTWTDMGGDLKDQTRLREERGRSFTRRSESGYLTRRSSRTRAREFAPEGPLIRPATRLPSPSRARSPVRRFSPDRLRSTSRSRRYQEDLWKASRPDLLEPSYSRRPRADLKPEIPRISQPDHRPTPSRPNILDNIDRPLYRSPSRPPQTSYETPHRRHFNNDLWQASRPDLQEPNPHRRRAQQTAQFNEDMWYASRPDLQRSFYDRVQTSFGDQFGGRPAPRDAFGWPWAMSGGV